MPTINDVREKYFLKYRNDPPDPSFQHTPPADKPTQPTFPGSLTAPEQAAVKNWRQARGTAKATLYAALDVAAKAKADLFIAWDAARHAWEAQDKAARQEEWAWYKADNAILTYDTVPKSGTTDGTGSGAPVFPATKQEL